MAEFSDGEKWPLRERDVWKAVTDEHRDDYNAKAVLSIAGKNSCFEMEVAKGNIEGYSTIFFAGENEAVSTSFVTIRPQGGRYSFPLTAGYRTISSTSANDSATGTGVQVVAIQWLDENYNRVTEIIALDGLNPVTSTVNSLRVNAFQAVVVGTNKYAEGNITIFKGADDLGRIDLGETNMRQQVYTVPAGKTWMATGFNPNCGKDDEVKIIPEATINGVPYRFSNTFLYQNNYTFKNTPMSPVPEKTDFEAIARKTGSAGSARISLIVEFYEVDNLQF